LPRRLSRSTLRTVRNRLTGHLRPRDVVAIYESLLGRTPSDAEIAAVRGHVSEASLVEQITTSDEYRERQRTLDAGGVDRVYRRLLDRAATDEETAYILDTAPSFDFALQLVTGSDEFLSRRPLAALLRPDDTSGNRQTDEYEELLAASSIGADELEALVAATGVELDETSQVYLRDHRVRFVELVGLVGVLHQASPLRRIAEIGPTKFLAPLLASLTGAEIVTVERPVADGGRDDAWAEAVGVTEHVNLDLNVTPLGDVLPEPVRGSCDLVVCGEVVEHLLADPAEILADLLELLAPGGLLVVTTPNYLALRSIRVMEAGRSPASRFSRAEGNVDAHYHLREYTMLEVEEAMAEAGYRVDLAAFSACWDAGDTIVAAWANRQVRANLVVVGSRAGDDVPTALDRWRGR
jgi:SAM-dependent methyltransferase